VSFKTSSILIKVVAAAVVLLPSFIAVQQAHAQKSSAPAAAPISIGSVDIQKILAGYNKKATQETAFQAVVSNYQSALQVQQANAMLSEPEQQQLGSLLLKSNRTPADESQIKALETKSQADASELIALQQKSSPTDADQARRAILAQEQQNGQQVLQSVADTYKQAIDQRNQQESDAIATEIKAAVAAVAQQRGLTLVFDSSVAIYAANDITPLVLARLNSAK